jgi:hypothetical protein
MKLDLKVVFKKKKEYNSLMQYLENVKFFVLTFLAIAITRLIPHQPNFTAIIALAFYIPLFFGSIGIFYVICSYIISDILIGFHPIVIFSWLSCALIGTISTYSKNYDKKKRFFFILISLIIFFTVSNTAAWQMHGYENNLRGLIECFNNALPFLKQNLLSTLIYSAIFELILLTKVKQSLKI